MTVTKKHGFASMAQNTAKLAGSSSAFVAICLITLVWLVTGPIFHWSDTWQLVINTVTNIVSMLMVFVIQNTQNRESAALQLKIDELLRAVQGAQNTFINLEELSEEDLNELKNKSAALERPANWAFKAGQYLDMTLLDPPETDSEAMCEVFRSQAGLTKKPLWWRRGCAIRRSNMC